jgi:hypothetical protein
VKKTGLLSATAGLALVLSAQFAAAQEREDRTLLDMNTMRAIINEASGERALHHIMEFVPYVRVRPIEEYKAHFRESEAMVNFAKQYGYSTAEIESYPTTAVQFQPTQAELWMVEPEVRKLFDIYDVPLSLPGIPPQGEVTAELVDAGMGQPQNTKGVDFTGKFVLIGQNGSRNGVQGAAGFVGYNNLRPDDQPDMIGQPNGGGGAFGGGQQQTNWQVSPRVGRELAGHLARGEKVVLKSIIKGETVPGEIELVHLTIAGDGSSRQSVAISCHLHEGYIKQGANDDASGCALTLEVGRAYIRLVQEGKLPKPKRTIHFLGVPEISGTNAYLNAHPEIASSMIADLNFDMDGLRLAANGSFWIIHRTPDTFPTYLNDVAQSFVEFVGNTNRERIRFRANGYDFSLPIVSENGSRDPLYYVIDKHYGSSDHTVYISRGVPAIMFITWPDPHYHSSLDIPQFLDPTMFKRAAVVTVGAMSLLASAGDDEGLKVAHENVGRGTERMGWNQRKGLGYMADATNGGELVDAYKEAKNAVRHQANVEKAVVRSASILFANPSDGAKQLQPFEALIDQTATTLQGEVTLAYKLRANQLKVQPVEPTMTAQEKEASTLLVERVATDNSRGFGGRRGAGNLSPEEQAVQQALAKIPQHMRSELNLLQPQKKTALETRDFVAGEFDPLPLADVMTVLRAQEKAGTIRLTTQGAVAQPKTAPPAKGAMK